MATVLEEAARRVAQTSNMDLELRLVYAETVAAAFSPLVTTLVLTRDREARTYVIGEMLRFCYSVLREIRIEWPQARRQIQPSNLPPLMQRALDMPSFQGRQGPIEEELRNIAYLALTNSLPLGSLHMVTNDPPAPGQATERQTVVLEPRKFKTYELRASEFINSAVQAKARRQVTLRLAGPTGAVEKEHAIFTVPFVDVLAGAHGSAVATDPVNNPHRISVTIGFMEATRDLTRRELQRPLDGDGLYAWGGIPALMGENELPVRDVTKIPNSYPPALEVQLAQEPPLAEPRIRASECQGTWSWTGATSRGPAPALQGAEAARPMAPLAPGPPTVAATLPGTLSLAAQAAASPVQAVAPLQVSARQGQPGADTSRRDTNVRDTAALWRAVCGDRRETQTTPRTVAYCRNGEIWCAPAEDATPEQLLRAGFTPGAALPGGARGTARPNPRTRLRRRKAKEAADAVQKAIHERYDALDRRVQVLTERLAAGGRPDLDLRCEEEDWGDDPDPDATTTGLGVGRAEEQDPCPAPPRPTTGSRDQRLNDLGLVVISLAGTQVDLGAGVTKDAPRSRREARERELVSHDPQAWLCISHRVHQGQAEKALVGSSFKRQAVINYPGMPMSKERADRVLHDLEGLANLLLLSYRWELGLPLPPEFPELDIQVLQDPECPRGLELKYQDVRSPRTAFRRWVLLLRRLVYHLGAEDEAADLLQKIANALALCIEGTELRDEPCLAQLGEQSPMRDTVRMEWEAVRARARTASKNADARVVIEQSPQLQVPPREVMSPPVHAMGLPPCSSGSHEEQKGRQAPREPPTPAAPDSGAAAPLAQAPRGLPTPAASDSGVAALLAQEPATTAEETHPAPATPGVIAPPSKSASARRDGPWSALGSTSSPCRTTWLLDGAGIGRGKKAKELQKRTPESPGVNLRVDPEEEESFLASHGV